MSVFCKAKQSKLVWDFKGTSLHERGGKSSENVVIRNISYIQARACDKT